MFRKLLKLISVCVLFSCCAYSQSPLSGINSVAEGIDIQNALNQSYANTVVDCGASTRPAFLCSGVLIRGTNTFSSSYHSWDPSPSSQSRGGISFSYLRKDSKFNHLAYGYNNGFIFYPYLNAPDGKNTDIDIMCAFPIDGWTDGRDEKGCGAYVSYPNDSGTCQAQGIYTAEQWYQHYQSGGYNHQYECGFETKDDSTYNTADAFHQTILGMALAGEESFNEQNELVLATWPQGMQNTLPMEAFFYVSGTSGLSSAQSNQQDFFDNTTAHIVVPVIEMKLPATQSEDVQFIYNESDQIIKHH